MHSVLVKHGQHIRRLTLPLAWSLSSDCGRRAHPVVRRLLRMLDAKPSVAQGLCEWPVASPPMVLCGSRLRCLELTRPVKLGPASHEVPDNTWCLPGLVHLRLTQWSTRRPVLTRQLLRALPWLTPSLSTLTVTKCKTRQLRVLLGRAALSRTWPSSSSSPWVPPEITLQAVWHHPLHAARQLSAMVDVPNLTHLVCCWRSMASRPTAAALALLLVPEWPRMTGLTALEVALPGLAGLDCCRLPSLTYLDMDGSLTARAHPEQFVALLQRHPQLLCLEVVGGASLGIGTVGQVLSAIDDHDLLRSLRHLTLRDVAGDDLTDEVLQRVKRSLPNLLSLQAGSIPSWDRWHWIGEMGSTARGQQRRHETSLPCLCFS